MGIPLFKVSTSWEEDSWVGRILGALGKKPAPPNPDPRKFLILRSEDYEGHCLLEIKYEGCTNYEGRKILLMDGNSWYYREKNHIDPHFTSEVDSPVARFEPTTRGWILGLSVLKSRIFHSTR